MCANCCASQFVLKHLLKIVRVVLVSEVKSMLAIQKAVYVKVFFDVQCFCYLVIASDPIIKAIAVLSQDPEYLVLLRPLRLSG